MSNKQMSCQQEEAQKRLDRSIMYIEDVVKISASEMKGLSADIAAGAKPSALSILLPDLDGRRQRTSALVVAASIGAVEVVSLFLQDAELDVNVANTDGFHALLAALRGGRRGTAQLLLPRSNVALADKWGQSCLEHAVNRELSDEAAAIVERMSDVERLQEFEKMRNQSLSGTTSASHGGLRMHIQALVLSKMESGALARATDAAFPKDARSPRRPSRL